MLSIIRERQPTSFERGRWRLECRRFSGRPPNQTPPIDPRTNYTRRRLDFPASISETNLHSPAGPQPMDWRWATVGLIALAALALIAPLDSRTADAPPRRDVLLVIAPLALLAGWLTIAKGLSTNSVLTSESSVPEQNATAAAVAGAAGTIAIAPTVYLRSLSFAYPLPVGSRRRLLRQGACAAHESAPPRLS